MLVNKCVKGKHITYNYYTKKKLWLYYDCHSYNYYYNNIIIIINNIFLLLSILLFLLILFLL